MPERGRPSASSGNAYHDVRVAHWLICLLEDASLTSIAVEAIDASIDDIVIQRTGAPARYEQVKERAPDGNWTAQRLSSEGILRQLIAQHRLTPDSKLVMFTGSSASAFREVVERARNAYLNHSTDTSGREAALSEWKQRLKARRSFVNQIVCLLQTGKDHQTITLQELQGVLACVEVLDAAGTLAQLRERNIERLRQLVDDPVRASQTLERMACEAAIHRSVMGRAEVEAALKEDGSGPRFAVFTLSVDSEAYEKRLLCESMATDVAKLPPLLHHISSCSGVQFSLHSVTGKALLVGSHGAGKSRLAAELAVKSIRSGRTCLHIRLALWATTLRELVVAELSRASKRHARFDDFEHLFAETGVLVLDGLDEVPAPQRSTAEREILQFGNTYPDIALLITSRPGSGHTLSQYWPTMKLQPLSQEQIEIALGRKLHTLRLGEPILALADNPLMLGLLVRQLAEDRHPANEAELLDAFVAESIERESRRMSAIDELSGHRLAEDVAFAWLSSGRIALKPQVLRSVTSSVALIWRQRAFVQLSATDIEHWLVEAGLAVNLEEVAIPVHRAVMDHLAARSMERRDAVQCVGVPELREAVARHIGGQTEVGEPMLELLDLVGTDL